MAVDGNTELGGDRKKLTRPGKRRRLRLDDAISSFLDAWPYEGPRVPSAATVRTYRGHLEWLAAFAATQRAYYVAELTPDLLRKAFRTCLTKEGARNYKGGQAKANGVAFSARALARWLLAQGMSVPDLTHLKPPEVPERIQPRIRPEEFRALEHTVLRRLMDETAQAPRISISRDLALLYVLSDAGIRADECCSMCVGDVDLDGGRIMVRRGKGGKQRTLSIRDPDDPRGGQTLRRLAEWIDMRSTLPRAEQHTYLWTSIRGTPLTPDQLRYVLKRICDKAGVENRPPHAFRRANFTERYQADPSQIDVLTARMGWAKNNHAMIGVYTRGAEIDLAATQELPSLASRWHTGSNGRPILKTVRGGGAAGIAR